MLETLHTIFFWEDCSEASTEGDVAQGYHLVLLRVRPSRTTTRLQGGQINNKYRQLIQLASGA